VQRGNGIESFQRAKFGGKEVLKTVSNIITDILNKKPEQPVGDNLKNHFSEAKDNLEHQIKRMMVSGLGLKRKHNLEKAQSHNKCRKVKDIFTEN